MDAPQAPETQQSKVNFDVDHDLNAQSASNVDESGSEVPVEEKSKPKRIFIGKKGGTTIYTSLSPEPWTIPCDAIVLPVDIDNRLGLMGSDILAHLRKQSDTIYESFFNNNVQSFTPPTPSEPRLVVLDDVFNQISFPVNLILATAQNSEAVFTLQDAKTAATSVVLEAEKQKFSRIILPLMGSGEGDLPPDEAAKEVYYGTLAALPTKHVKEITLVTQHDTAVNALQEISVTRAQTFHNDLAAGHDLLNIESEVYALADSLLLRELQPPLVVGVLGGWGSGKSFVMHLLRERINEVRSMEIKDTNAPWSEDPNTAFPYIGHSYVVNFDAWTYAKADLWSSLMQSIFQELSQQLALEQNLKNQNINPLTGGNLWRAVSLLNEPERLEILRSNLSAEEREKLLEASEQTTETDVLWKHMEEIHKEKLDKLDNTRKELETANIQLSNAEQELRNRVDNQISQTAKYLAWEKVAGISQKMFENAYTRYKENKNKETTVDDQQNILDEAALAFKNINELRDSISFFDKVFHAKPTELIVIIAGALIIGFSPTIFNILSNFQTPATIVALLSSLTAVQRGISNWNKWFAQAKTIFDESETQHLEREQQRREELYDKLLNEEKQRYIEDKDKQRPLPTAEKNIIALQQQIKKLETDVQTQESQIGMRASFVSLSDFVSSRLQESPYENKLGLMHQVKQDIEDLTSSLIVYDQDVHENQKKEFFPRGPARVFLFIDDLDRCPPEQVVAVLEAAQLLVKTRLFVVVLAMDVRYITRALEHKYQGILKRRGDPSGLDYIEKIIQIPYRVRPVESEALESFLTSQIQVFTTGGTETPDNPDQHIEPSTKEDKHKRDKLKAEQQAKLHTPLPNRVVMASPEELAMIRAGCEKITISPRSIKRIVNIFKLLKIIWYQGIRYIDPGWDIKKVVITLLILSERHPDCMRFLLDKLAHALTNNEDVSQSLSQWAESIPLSKEIALSGQDNWQFITGILSDTELVPRDITLEKFGIATTNLTRSFSFVGDIGHDPDEERNEYELEKTLTTLLQQNSRQYQVNEEMQQSKEETSSD